MRRKVGFSSASGSAECGRLRPGPMRQFSHDPLPLALVQRAPFGDLGQRAAAAEA